MKPDEVDRSAREFFAADKAASDAAWSVMSARLADMGFPTELEPSEKVCAHLPLDAAHRKACRCST